MKQIQYLQIIIYNPTFGQYTELGAMCQQNALQHTTNNNKKLQNKGQKKPGETTEETSGCVIPERINKWPNSTIPRW